MHVENAQIKTSSSSATSLMKPQSKATSEAREMTMEEQEKLIMELGLRLQYEKEKK